MCRAGFPQCLGTTLLVVVEKVLAIHTVGRWMLAVDSVVRVLVDDTGGREWRLLLVESAGVYTAGEQHLW